ncbi:inorganic pyrophosphatase [Enterococcus sp. 5H]|uniref:inorganic pyrophosphatase n=1 Tax=Enterococcus sp. 5H TaxID=1229490 RepID=UPI0023049318|nr:inorganic pyrophosphatase [Enterococcus sp. 5H]MDA9471025.1 Inorganic pyrophosphatase [Enterococcus sp. 5H]
MEKLKVIVTIDRPIGYKDSFGNTYPINYGYISGVIGGDDEEQDAYVLNVPSKKLKNFTGFVAAVIHRNDDVETKWIVIPEDTQITEEEILKQTFFIEQYFDSHIEMLK